VADRTIALKDLRRRLQEMTSTQNDEDFSVTELNDAIVSAAAETTDHIITSGLSEQTLLAHDMTASTPDVDLSASLNFYKIAKVYVNESGQLRPVERINLQDIYPYRPISQPVSIRILYIPFMSTMKNADGSYDDEATFDGINGWEEHTLHTAALQVKGKKEDDATWHRQRKAELEDRMKFLGNTDFSGPARVVRKRGARREYALPYNSQLSAWTIRNKTISFWYNYPWVP
jgi:hypothetical protein